MTTPSLDRIVAGVSCREVLAALGDLLDGEVAEPRRAQLLAHVDACDTCARFGTDVQGALAALRTHRLTPPPDPATLERLRATITAAIARDAP